MKKAPTVSSQSTQNNHIQHRNNTTVSSEVTALSTAAQRARILKHLQSGQRLTTLYARHYLNVMHPAARVMELRERGYKIITHRRKDTDSAGRLHSVAEYVLLAGGDS